MSSHRRRDATFPTPVHRRNVVSLLLSLPRTPPRRGKHPARRADRAAGKGRGRKRRPCCNGADRGCNITPPRKRADFPLVWRHERTWPTDFRERRRTVTSSNACWCGPQPWRRGLSAPGGYREGFFRRAAAVRVCAMRRPRGTICWFGGLELPHGRPGSNDPSTSNRLGLLAPRG